MEILSLAIRAIARGIQVGFWGNKVLNHHILFVVFFLITVDYLTSYVYYEMQNIL